MIAHVPKYKEYSGFFKSVPLLLAVVLLCACSLTVNVNIGGTINSVPIDKSQCGTNNVMTSETKADEKNPSAATVNLPLGGVL